MLFSGTPKYRAMLNRLSPGRTRYTQQRLPQGSSRRYRSDWGVGRGVRRAVGSGVGVAVGVGDGEGLAVGVGDGVVTTADGAIDGATDVTAAGDTTATPDALLDGPSGVMLAPSPRARTKPIDAVSAKTSTTSDASIAGDTVRPAWTTGAGGAAAATDVPRR
jgi:hypothetical protein